MIFTFQNSNEFPYVLRIVFKSGEKKPNVYYYRVYDFGLSVLFMVGSSFGIEIKKSQLEKMS